MLPARKQCLTGIAQAMGANGATAHRSRWHRRGRWFGPQDGRPGRVQPAASGAVAKRWLNCLHQITTLAAAAGSLSAPSGTG